MLFLSASEYPSNSVVLKRMGQCAEVLQKESTVQPSLVSGGGNMDQSAAEGILSQPQKSSNDCSTSKRETVKSELLWIRLSPDTSAGP